MTPGSSREFVCRCRFLKVFEAISATSIIEHQSSSSKDDINLTYQERVEDFVSQRPVEKGKTDDQSKWDWPAQRYWSEILLSVEDFHRARASAARCFASDML